MTINEYKAAASEQIFKYQKNGFFTANHKSFNIDTATLTSKLKAETEITYGQRDRQPDNKTYTDRQTAREQNIHTGRQTDSISRTNWPTQIGKIYATVG